MKISIFTENINDIPITEQEYFWCSFPWTPCHGRLHTGWPEEFIPRNRTMFWVSVPLLDSGWFYKVNSWQYAFGDFHMLGWKI